MNRKFEHVAANSTNEKWNNMIKREKPLYARNEEAKWICFSSEKLSLIDSIKKYNYANIYLNPRMDAANEYFKVVINRIYNTLKNLYSEGNEIIRFWNKKKSICYYANALSLPEIIWSYSYKCLLFIQKYLVNCIAILSIKSHKNWISKMFPL